LTVDLKASTKRTATAGLCGRMRRTMSRMSQGMNSLSSTGSFIGGGEQRVVSFGVVGAELALTRSFQLLAQPRWVWIKLLFFHPAQECLARHFAGVRITFGQLLLDEFLDWLCHGD